MHLVIRTDATTQIGTGHIMRCIALAQEWKGKCGDVTFLSHCDSEALRQRIIAEGFDFVPIEKPHPDSYDFDRTFEILEKLKAQNSNLKSWCVIDGYNFTPDYQRAIRENGYNLLIIDDMAHLNYYHADILLNQNIYASSIQYSCNRSAVKLSGCEYVMLRREFLKYKDWKREIPKKAKNILVTLGGSDPDNVTLKVIRALNCLNDPDLEVKIIAGPANPNINSLEKELHLSSFTGYLLSNVNNMPELMAWADMAVSAGGSTCYETAFMGLPFLTIVLADNQRDISRGLCERGVSLHLCRHGDLSLEKMVFCLSDVIHNPNTRQKFSAAGQELIDGQGARRIVDIIVRAAK